MMSRIDSQHRKISTGRHFQNARHNYEMSLKSDNVEFVRYCGGHFENGDR
jgi:hypothetical protein